MSEIIYVVPNRFINYSLNAPVSVMNRGSVQNKGGGISTKVHRVCEAWEEYYDVTMTEYITRFPNAYTVVLEPLMARMTKDSERVVTQYSEHQATFKVLYCSEQAMMEIPLALRDKLIEASTVVTTCCGFQEKQFETMGYSSVRLCDPIPSVFYNPTAEKDISVVAMGRISQEKNSQLVLEVFKMLTDSEIRTVYIGGASLWGGATMDDKRLEAEIRKHSTEFHHNVSQPKVAEILHGISFGIFDTDHDTCSESNQESLMAGIYCLYGGHGLWFERPGIHRVEGAMAFVDALRHSTKEFTELPPAERRVEAEEWALKNCSYETFLSQWQGVRRNAKSI